MSAATSWNYAPPDADVRAATIPDDAPPGVKRALKIAHEAFARAAPMMPPRHILMVEADDTGPTLSIPTSLAIVVGEHGVTMQGPGFELGVVPLDVIVRRVRALGEQNFADTIERVARPELVTVLAMARDGSFHVVALGKVDLSKPAGNA